jgi:shikimate kinase
MTAPCAVLIGPPGSGKTTVGQLLATAWGVGFRDTDDDIVRTSGRTIADIFIEDGEAAFRDLERTAVAAALAEHDGVLALGGGAVLDPRTQADLADHIVVFLDVSLAHAVPRVGLNASRPLLLGNPRARWQALMDARRPIYQSLATVMISTDGLTPSDVTQQVLDALNAFQEDAP